MSSVSKAMSGTCNLEFQIFLNFAMTNTLTIN